MEAISFKLDAFEGPLDVLLFLVSKHKLNIYDIEISLLLDQYLEYIEGIEKLDYDQAADFFEMAARLIYIKTCYLLPQPEEAEELKKELQGRMIEYSLCKLAAQRLKENYAGGLVFVRAPVKLPVNKQHTRIYDKQVLYDAYMAIASKAKNYTPLRANMFSPLVSKRIVSVESKIAYVLERLFTTGSFDMSTLYDGMEDRSERIATFLAVLELTKSGKARLNDDNTVIELRKDAPEDEEDEAEPPVEQEAAEPDEPETPAEAEEPSAPEPDAPEVPAEAEEPSAPEPDEPETPAEAEEPSAPEPDAPEVPTEAEEPSSPEPEVPEVLSEETPDEKPAPRRTTKHYSMPLALETHTALLRLPAYEAVPAAAMISLEDTPDSDEPEPTEEVKTEPSVAEAAPAISMEPESEVTEAVPAVAEVVQPVEPAVNEPAPAISAESEPESTYFKPNYYGSRYFWGYARLENDRRSYLTAVRTRI